MNGMDHCLAVELRGWTKPGLCRTAMGFSSFPPGGLRWFAALAMGLKAEEHVFPGGLGLSMVRLQGVFGVPGNT